MKKYTSSLTARHETLIIELIIEAKELVVLIANGFPSKESGYLLQSLFLVLRQMGYFFTENNSPILSYGLSLSTEEKDILKRIKDIRDGIGHRESPNNYFNARVKISGLMSFKDDDVVIQYGDNKIYLVGEIIRIHRRLRNLFASVSELKSLSNLSGWKMAEKELLEAEGTLVKKLKDFTATQYF